MTAATTSTGSPVAGPDGWTDIRVAIAYTMITVRSTVKDARFMIFTIALPTVMYLLFDALYGNDTAGGMNGGAYLMVSMAAYGGIGAALNSGARIAVERQTGWNRLLSLSALTPAGYVGARIAVAMVVAVPTITIVLVTGMVTGHAHPGPTRLAVCGAILWCTLVPFAVMGIGIGYIGNLNAAQPLSMLSYVALTILGGLWIPVDQLPGLLRRLAHLLPSYWTAEIARRPLADRPIPLGGVLVGVVWTVGLGLVASTAYRRSGRRA